MTKGQAKLLVSEKIEKFAEKYPRLGDAISKIKNNGNETVVVFKGGSTITCVAPNDNARGYRANILIMDEYRMIKKDVIDLVLKRFLASSRSPKFLTRPEYDGFPMDEYEKNKSIYMSSAWMKNHWSWDLFSETVENMCMDDETSSNYCAVSLPYTVPLYHGILPLSTVETDLREMGENSPKWMMEMEAMFYGLSEDAFFSFDIVDNAMSLREVFIPDCNIEKGKGCKYDFSLSKIEDGEIRLLSVDVGGTGNDNTVIVGIRCVPVEYGRSDNKRYYYKKEIVFIKHLPVQHGEVTAIELKKLYNDFGASHVIMDTMGVSQVLYEGCCKQNYDKKTDTYYDAWSCINDEKLDKLKLDDKAIPVIYSVRAGASFNSEIANKLKDELSAKRVLLPISNEDAMSEFVDEIKEFDNMSVERQTAFLQTFYESYATMIELTNLEAVFKDNGLVSIEKPKGGKILRDRYTALAYGVWYACEKEKENLNRNKKKKSSFKLKYIPQDYFSK